MTQKTHIKGSFFASLTEKSKSEIDMSINEGSSASSYFDALYKYKNEIGVVEFYLVRVQSYREVPDHIEIVTDDIIEYKPFTVLRKTQPYFLSEGTGDTIKDKRISNLYSGFFYRPSKVYYITKYRVRGEQKINKLVSLEIWRGMVYYSVDKGPNSVDLELKGLKPPSSPNSNKKKELPKGFRSFTQLYYDGKDTLGHIVLIHIFISAFLMMVLSEFKPYWINYFDFGLGPIITSLTPFILVFIISVFVYYYLMLRYQRIAESI